MRKTLSETRYRHSLSVARLSERLAKRHRMNPERAYIIGLLHDCAKEWTPAKLQAYAAKKKLSIPHADFMRAHSPNMYHAYVGAAYAKERGWLTDPVSLQAVMSHTLGNLRMSREDKVLYIADFANHDRKRLRLRKIRQAAMNNLEEGFKMAMTQKLKWYVKRRKTIHPFAVDVWNAMIAR